jgi:hypothetical protein
MNITNRKFKVVLQCAQNMLILFKSQITEDPATKQGDSKTGSNIILAPNDADYFPLYGGMLTSISLECKVVPFLWQGLQLLNSKPPLKHTEL